ncbi:MAG TPA: TetR/AcrR family transcriptional regulator; helix-turn-helix transcriptional regulator [Candidatus Dietzia merdigallinarum]|uniref:TetR/AcrR family transcriptional regulator n=1 Tax=Arthrobacter koreensis TaxID=199136 RepID=UPI001C3B2C3A|nr:TetR/AcrR family transcriptional regulator; helix-turn-helix transcriptional regulator [Candidatus Dietzia merdigallinarum]
MAEIVSDVGPGNLTVAEVASRVGVSAPAVRQRFGSKRDLLIAFATRSADAATGAFDAAAAQATDPLDALARGLGACGSFADRAEMAHHLALLHLDLTDPVLSELASRHSRALRAAIWTQIATAVERGQLAAGCTIDDLADSVYTTFNGALLTWAIDGDGSSGDWLAERLRRTLEPHRAR